MTARLRVEVSQARRGLPTLPGLALQLLLTRVRAREGLLLARINLQISAATPAARSSADFQLLGLASDL